MLSNNFRYKKSLAQHFLLDKNLLRKIPTYATKQGGAALEIGAGSGNLTSILAQYFHPLIAIEKDHRLIEPLKKRSPQVSIYEMDFLSFPQSFLCTEIASLGKIPLFSNIPYHLTAKFLSIFADYAHLFSEAVLLVQKEVADKLTSFFPNSFLTAKMQSIAKIKKCAPVPKEAFCPPPKVDSSLIHLQFIPWDPQNWKRYISFLAFLFERKRKQLFSSLRKRYPPSLITQLLQNTKIRVEELNVQQLIDLFFSLDKKV